jgi:CDP-diacylglycerol---glycerol-3-phosphate 3-phosphatidyltransferase
MAWPPRSLAAARDDGGEGPRRRRCRLLRVISAWRPTPADVLTLLRLASLPVLWALAYAGLSVQLGVVLALAGLTDVLDGPVARRTGRSSRYGGQLDSVADILLMVSIVLWMAWLHPAFFRDNFYPLLVWVVIGVAALTVTLVRFGRIGNLHLYSAKVAGVVAYVFAVWLFVTGGYHPAFFGLAVGLAILGATETLLVAATRDHVDERVGSLFSRRR